MAHSSPCSLDDEGLDQRIRAWQSLRNAWLGSDRTATGALVRYRLDAAAARTLAELIEAEGRCCPSVSFEATVILRIDAPADVRPWVVSAFVDQPGNAAAPGGKEPSGVDREAVAEAVRAHYAAAARPAAPGEREEADKAEVVGIGTSAYGPAELGALPERVVRSSIGCANPVAVAELRPGDIVVDLGSGGGMDVLLSARRVGPTGKAYGVDMTNEMLELARKNQAEAGIHNAEFLRGRIEAIPLPDDSVDVVLSNCVIGHSPDKDAVFAEICRVLRPGGRLAIADVVADVEATPGQRAVVENWVSCLAGSLTRSQYRALLEDAGFVGVSIHESHRVADGFDSAIVGATKPAG